MKHLIQLKREMMICNLFLCCKSIFPTRSGHCSVWWRHYLRFQATPALEKDCGSRPMPSTNRASSRSLGTTRASEGGQFTFCKSQGFISKSNDPCSRLFNTDLFGKSTRREGGGKLFYSLNELTYTIWLKALHLNFIILQRSSNCDLYMKMLVI
jgi:hypothetical protein